MTWDQYLGFAAKDHTDAQGPTTETGHDDPDGTTMSQRLEKYGQFTATSGENIAYGTTGAEAIVIALLIDDGVPNRGHRVNIFKAEYKVLGAWTGSHGQYGSMTTINYAGGFTGNGDHPLTANNADTCNDNTDSSTCAAVTNCLWDSAANKCNTDACLSHADQTACDAGDKCFWTASTT